MIRGHVTPDREAVVRIAVSSLTGQSLDIDAVVDTGFTGFLTLPSAVIARLNLLWRTRGRSLIADGSEVEYNVYVANLFWDDQPRSALVESAEVQPLVGMALLHGYELRVQVVDGGDVTIKPLEESALRGLGSG